MSIMDRSWGAITAVVGSVVDRSEPYETDESASEFTESVEGLVGWDGDSVTGVEGGILY